MSQSPGTCWWFWYPRDHTWCGTFERHARFLSSLGVPVVQADEPPAAKPVEEYRQEKSPERAQLAGCTPRAVSENHSTKGFMP